MSVKKMSQNRLVAAILGGFFAFMSLFMTFLPTQPVFADPIEENPTTITTEKEQKDNSELDSPEPEATGETCEKKMGSIGWLVCPTTGKISEAVDWLYDKIQDILVINPISTTDDSPIYNIWKYCRDITNIVFVIFLLVVIYSQITGFGINNYGVKKALPKLIVAAILVNLSFLICSLAVDVSNVIGQSLRGVFTAAEEAAIANMPAAGETAQNAYASFSGIFSAIAGGTAAVGIGAVAAFESGAIWMLIPLVLGAVVAVVSGLITIALRQAVVALLIMISPLAMVANILPNTEQYFKKWKDLLLKMLVFYPMFSLLFGASHLAGFAIVASAKDGFVVLLGMAVQVLPLFLSWSLMKMSGTILGTVNEKLRGLAAKPLAANRAWADSHRAQTRANVLRNGVTPSARLVRYLDYRKALREKNTEVMMSEYKKGIDKDVSNRFSSYRGRNTDGLDMFDKKPNKYTINAKRANMADLRASTAESRFKNTVSGYGTVFKGNKDALKLNASAGEAFKDYAAQEFLTANNAQADEDFLFGAYTEAVNNRFSNPQQYNRLVKNAAGELGLKGEATVMGQAIQKNAKTEAQRRSEALIMISKFGYDRASFHSAATGIMRNADGYAIDAQGNVIEDSMFRLLAGKQYVKWDKYEIDPVTGKKVAYFDMYNDEHKPVQRVYMNDNGYMKELLTDDIMVGDPVNRLYEMSAGIGDAHAENGPLRKYYSTIAKNITSWKDHSGGSTPMLAAMIRNGTLNSEGKFTIGYLQSLKSATKASAFLTNDKFVINDLNKVFVAANPDLFMTVDGKINEKAAAFTDLKAGDTWVPFEYYIPDNDIEDYLDVKKMQLDGLRFDEQNNKWEKIAFNDPTLTTEDKKNMVKRDLIPGVMKKLFALTNRKMSPNILENQKPPTAEALANMLEIFNIIGQKDPSIYNTTDPDALRRFAEEAKKTAGAFRNAASNNSHAVSGQQEDDTHINIEGLATLRERVERASNSRAYREWQNSSAYSAEMLRDIIDGEYGLDDLCAVLKDFVVNNNIDPVLKVQIENIIEENQSPERSTSQKDAAHNMAHFYEDETERIEKLRKAIEDLLGGLD